jgi:hypothetical protein
MMTIAMRQHQENTPRKTTHGLRDLRPTTAPLQAMRPAPTPPATSRRLAAAAHLHCPAGPRCSSRTTAPAAPSLSLRMPQALRGVQ